MPYPSHTGDGRTWRVALLHRTSDDAAPAADRPRLPAKASAPVIAYAPPAAALAELVTGHQVYAAPVGTPRVERLLPGVANVRIALGAGTVGVQIGRRRFDPVPDVALTGPTTRAPRATMAGGGVIVAFGITPLGWARLFDAPAADLADRVRPLDEVAGSELPLALRRALAGVDPFDAAAAGRAIDEVLLSRLGPPGPDEAAIRALADALADPGVRSVVDMAKRTGLEAASVRRVADRHFGLTPKLALRRARFLRAFLLFFRNPDVKGYGAIAPGYHDLPHFLRDADRFLGMTPRRFAMEATDLLDASLRARADALGAPACVVHPADGGSAA